MSTRGPNFNAIGDYQHTFRTAMSFVANPLNLWISPSLEHKRTVLNLVFERRLEYSRKEGFRTAEISLPFKALQDSSASKNRLASPRGVEPRSVLSCKAILK